MRKEHIQIMKEYTYPENLILILLDLDPTMERDDIHISDTILCLPDHITERAKNVTISALKRQHIAETANEFHISLSYTHQLISSTLYGMRTSLRNLYMYHNNMPIKIWNGDFKLWQDLNFYSVISEKTPKDITFPEIIDKPLLGFGDNFFQDRNYGRLSSYLNPGHHRLLRYMIGNDHKFFQRIRIEIENRKSKQKGYKYE